MPSFLRPFLAAMLLSTSVGLAFAGASSVPFDYKPDPGLRTAGKGELETRIRRGCTATQARHQNVAETTLVRPCGCYASRVMRSLDDGELDAYRNTGFFNDSARAKALAALDACKLPRPV